MSAVEALELITDLIEKGGVFAGDYQTACAMLGDIETLAVSYEEIDFIEQRELLGLDK